jgi:hypothetical protein
MKLLVAVETLIGSRIAKSMAGTFSAHDPIPSSPLTVPARYINPNPRRAPVTR